MKHLDYSIVPFFAFDAETGIHNTGDDAVGKMKASPHHPDNKIVWYGVSTLEKYSIMRIKEDNPLKWGMDKIKTSQVPDCLLSAMENGLLMVGHNLKFDLLHLMKDERTKESLLYWLRDGGQIWDTMVVQYLLSGQQDQFISLDELSSRFGGELKDSRMKEYWDSGVSTEDIPDVEIIPYLQGDVRNTVNNFMHQLFEINNNMGGDELKNFLTLVNTQMEAILATTMCEDNGMYFDMSRASDEAKVMAERHTNAVEFLSKRMSDTFEHYNKYKGYTVEKDDVNPASGKQISTLLCGGDFSIVRDVVQLDEDFKIIRYKSGIKKGLPKTKKEKLTFAVSGLLHSIPDYLDKTSNGYRLDEFSLKKILSDIKNKKLATDKPTEEFITALLRFRSLQKELTVSYIGLMELVWPTDSCVHGNLNHCATGTGRLSSSAPNQQNFSSKETKE